MTDPVTRTQLVNASLDAAALEAFVNGGVSPGTYTTRTGRHGYTLAYLESLAPLNVTGDGGIQVINGTVGSGDRPDSQIYVSHDGTGHALITLHQSQVGKSAGVSGREEAAFLFLLNDDSNQALHAGSIACAYAKADAGEDIPVLRLECAWRHGGVEYEEAFVRIWGGSAGQSGGGIGIFAGGASPAVADAVDQAPGYNNLRISGNVGIGGSPSAKPGGYAGNFLKLLGNGNMLVIDNTQAGTSGTDNQDEVYMRMQSLGGDLLFGVESAAGGDLILGGTSYASVLVAKAGTKLHLGSDDAIAITLDTDQIANFATTAANGSVATVLGSVGPPGAHTAPQYWLHVRDINGVNGYIPCF